MMCGIRFNTSKITIFDAFPSWIQDPAMSGMLSNLTNPAHKEQLEHRMAQVREDPTLKPVLEEIETGGPAAMMK